MSKLNERQAEGLLTEAVTRLRDHGLEVVSNPLHAVGGASFDFQLTLRRGDEERRYGVELRQGNLSPSRLVTVRPSAEPLLVVADYISPATQRTLAQRHIDYVDGAGNLHLDWPSLYVHVEGRRPEFEFNAPLARDAFTKGGAKTIFGLLARPSLAEEPQRTLAEATGVSLGTVNTTIRSLAAQDFLRNNTLVHGRRLLDRWVIAYGERLAPDLETGRYAATLPGWWQGLDLLSVAPECRWGGEFAAERIDNYLRSTTQTIYAPDRPTSLLAEARMRRDPNGEVTVRQRFWNPEALPGPTPDLAPTVLIYADLIASGDPRQGEQADRLRQTHPDLVGIDEL